MRQVVETNASPLFMEEVAESDICIGAEEYLQRLALLRERMKETGKTHVVLYGDREHFSNLEYFCGYDSRFEEALLVVTATEVSILVGNEGVSQTYPIPFPVQVLLYQNFSLQGQPRNKLEPLSALLAKTGIGPTSKVGLCGYKYFDEGTISGDVTRTFDLPAYMVDAVLECGCDVVNFTPEITGLPNGLRMRVRSAREIAVIENAGNRTAAVVQRMFKALKPGLTEVEIGHLGRPGLEPQSVHAMVNFGAEHVRVGVRSPSFRPLQLGEVCALCYSSRHNLTSRVCVAAYSEDTVSPALRTHLDFYKNHWLATTRWAESARVGATAGEMYDAVMDVIGGPEYGVTLNPSHYSSTDEWSNAATYKGSPIPVLDGVQIQVDIIASSADPVMTAICEDGVVLAGAALREELACSYPEVWLRIQKRQAAIREVLGIAISDDVLPMSNLTFVQYPYMLNLERVFALK